MRPVAISPCGTCGSSLEASIDSPRRFSSRASISGELPIGSGISSARAVRNGVPGMKSSILIRCTPWQTTWDSVAVRSCIDARFLQWPKRECRGPAPPQRKVSPRIAPRIHNPSPFVQTHGSLGLSRLWPADYRRRAC
jgi:hypothetical protein